MKKPRVAIVHDFLMQHGGAENVTLAFLEMFPEAPLYTLFYDLQRVGKEFQGREIRTSFLQKMPFPRGKYQWVLPLMGLATETFDFSSFDVVLSSSNVHSKGIIVPEHTTHIAYCHTPARYLWTESASYVKNLRYPSFVKPAIIAHLSKLRIWDYLAAQRPDIFLANSQFVQKRIKKYYGRESTVVYPPLSLENFCLGKGDGSYFLIGGRMVAYKKFDLAIRAFNRLRTKLKVFGEGPFLPVLQKIAGPNIEFLGKVSGEEKNKLFGGARAFLFPQVEDFGITAIEAMATGRPVIAYRAGGVKETILEGITGEFFDYDEWEALADAVVRFDEHKYNPETIRAHALSFRKERFHDEIQKIIDEIWKTKI